MECHGIETILRKLGKDTPELLKEFSCSDVLLALDADDHIYFLPQNRSCVADMLHCRRIVEILFFGVDGLYLDLVRDVRAHRPRLFVGRYLPSQKEISYDLSAIRRESSYFDCLLCGSAEVSEALFGNTNEAIELICVNEER